MPTKIAVIQDSPVLFDKKRTIEKVGKLTKDAAIAGANLILFPEVFIPCYPRGLSFGTVVGSRSPKGREVWLKYWENSIEIPSEDCESLKSIARKNNVFLVIGVTERDVDTQGTLYCTLLFFAPNGELIGKHRKLKPTAAERIIWGEGDGKSLNVYETGFGKIGGLICWENYMPAARMELYKKGVQIYLAPTADARERWLASMRHIALEGRCYVLSCNQFVRKDMYPQDLPMIEELKDFPEIMSNGGSAIISPMGEIIAGPLNDKAGILYADIDLEEIAKAKFDFDVMGHYFRRDLNI